MKWETEERTRKEKNVESAKETLVVVESDSCRGMKSENGGLFWSSYSHKLDITLIVCREMERSMRHMDRMMGSMMNEMMMDPFAMLRGGGPAMAMLEDGAGGQGRRPTARRNEVCLEEVFNLLAACTSLHGSVRWIRFRRRSLASDGSWTSLAERLDVQNELQHAALNDPNSHVFTQSTVMTFDESGRPRVEKKSVRKTGDVKETRRFVLLNEAKIHEKGNVLDFPIRMLAVSLVVRGQDEKGAGVNTCCLRGLFLLSPLRSAVIAVKKAGAWDVCPPFLSLISLSSLSHHILLLLLSAIPFSREIFHVIASSLLF